MSNRFIPPEFPGFHCVGYVQSAHGIRGEIFVQLYARKADWLNSLKDLYLLLLLPQTSSLKSFSVENCRPHKEGLIAVLRGVTTRNESELFRKSGAYIPVDLLEAPPGEAIFLKQIENFSVVDAGGTVLGQITGFASNGPQDLLKVALAGDGGREALIPFVDAFLLDIDFDKQQVKMDLPPGLLNLED